MILGKTVFLELEDDFIGVFLRVIDQVYGGARRYLEDLMEVGVVKGAHADHLVYLFRQGV